MKSVETDAKLRV